MTVVNVDAIRTATLAEKPFPYAVVGDSFVDRAATATLADEFPTEGFRYDARESTADGRKRYRTYNYQLVGFGQPARDNIARLSDRWRRVLDDLTADSYRAAVAAVTGTDLTGTVLDVRLVRYSQDCWIAPHVDRPDKVVTQLFYLNLEWLEQWAGALRILHGPDLDDYERQVFPHAGTSVLMVRTDTAWHGVPPVCSSGQDRLVLLVHFARPGAEG